MIVGDVFAVPLRSGDYGLCQVIRRNNESKWGDTITVLFDVKLSLNELRTFNYASIYKLKIITGIPVMLLDSKKYPSLILKVANMMPVEWDVPLFKVGSSMNEYGEIQVVDFNRTHYRYVSKEVAKKMNLEFSKVGYIVIPDILSNYFDNTNVEKNKKDIDWWKNAITDRDMRENPHLYFRVLNSDRWDALGNAIIELPDRTNKVQEILSSIYD